ncbi:MAG: TM0106 family RecB-like putative nuclease [Bacteroidota bacterium]
MKITASMLYDHIQCPHRVTMDQFADPQKKDPVSPFVELLWKRGVQYEKEVIDGLQIPYSDLSSYSSEERQQKTTELMNQGTELIYAGRIQADNLLGDPDLLKNTGNGYLAGDIKSGAGLEGASEDVTGRPKKHYAVQLALYTDILERIGQSAGRSPFIWDRNGDQIPYELNSALGTKATDTMWDLYQSELSTVQSLLKHPETSLPAYSSTCKMCHWRSACLKQIKEHNDLTLIPELGRSGRDTLISHIKSVPDLAVADLDQFISGKKTIFPGIGKDRLFKFQERAKLLQQADAKPYLTETIELPQTEVELFFDVETDPFNDVCYLHGFTERHHGDNSTEAYVDFYMEEMTQTEEKRIFEEAWKYIQSKQPCAIYYYSHYEKTIMRKLRKKYPDVVNEDELESLLADFNAVDLFQIVRSCSEWPTNDHSIKTLAKYCGFEWRDTDPSGAASIEWYHRWLETGDPDIKNRILEYNEDDCIAMRVLMDKLSELESQRGQ